MPFSDRRRLPWLILVVDDDYGDQILIQEALQASGICKQIQIVSDGEEAMEYLRGQGRYAALGSCRRPDLILLDLNMPRLGGKEVLAMIKADQNFRSIPVVAFTTSGRQEDISQCYGLGVNSYVQKPVNFQEFQRVLRRVEEYWLEISLPPPPPGVN